MKREAMRLVNGGDHYGHRTPTEVAGACIGPWGGNTGYPRQFGMPHHRLYSGND